MSEAARIADQLRRSFRGDAWHGPSLTEVLDGVTAAMADKRIAPDIHSIRDLVLHCEAWVRAAVQMLDGQGVRLSTTEDWPVGETGDWQEQLASLAEGVEALAARIEQLSDEELEAKIPGREFSAYVLLHGVVQHNLYHAGQIAILKKA